MRLLIFGDSITQGMHDPEGGWADRLKRMLLHDDQHSVFNLGISGDKTADVLERFNAELAARTKRWDSRSQTVIVFAIGTNDSYLKNPGGHIAVTNDKFTDNVQQLTRLASDAAKHVVWLPILPVDESLTAPCMHDPVSYYNSRIDQFNDIIKEQCENDWTDGSVRFIDYDTKPVLSDLPDGLHPGATAHDYIARKCYSALDELLK